MLGGFTIINSGNLNDYRDIGRYFLGTPSQITNSPTNQRGYLFVFRSNAYSSQLVIGQDGFIGFRWNLYNGTSFGSWLKVQLKAD